MIYDAMIVCVGQNGAVGDWNEQKVKFSEEKALMWLELINNEKQYLHATYSMTTKRQLIG